MIFDFFFFLFFLLGGVTAERMGVPWAPQVTRILRWTLLDNVEAAHVWVHRCNPGFEGGWGGPEGIPTFIRPNYRIWQQASSAVHQFPCCQATRRLGSQLNLCNHPCNIVDYYLCVTPIMIIRSMGVRFAFNLYLGCCCCCSNFFGFLPDFGFFFFFIYILIIESFVFSFINLGLGCSV